MFATMRTYDLHAHCAVPEVRPLVADQPGWADEGRRLAAGMGPDSTAHNARRFAGWVGRLAEADGGAGERLAAMDAVGVDVQVVSPAPSEYHYWADEARAADIVAATNEGVVALCARHPDRLVGLGSVALQHPALGADQLCHAVGELGLAGAVIGTQAGGADFSAARYAPLWAAAEELGAVLFVHPWGCTLGERLARSYLMNIVGNPIETTVALAHLIFGGVLDRHPGLRVVAAHGGWLPALLPGPGRPRLAGAGGLPHERRAPVRLPAPAVVRQLVHDPRLLGHLIDNVGADRVVLGTDYPFDMGVDDPVRRLDAAGLAEADRAAVAGGTAVELLKGAGA
jgi:aminocarboxymuconate-semialdehyde decarboxylase